MKLLCDANLSPQVVHALSEAGFDVSHVGDHELLTATDPEIFDWAIDNERVIITADSDFGALLALRRTSSPSVVLLREMADQGPDVHSRVLIENLPSIEDVLTKGAIVSLSPTGLRAREIPPPLNRNMPW